MAVKTDLSECSDINLEHAMFSQFGFFALYALLIDFIPSKQTKDSVVPGCEWFAYIQAFQNILSIGNGKIQLVYDWDDSVRW